MKLADCTERAIAEAFAFMNNKRLAYCWSNGLWFNKEGGQKGGNYWRNASRNRLINEIGKVCLDRARELEAGSVASGHPHLILQIASASAIENIERLLRSHEFFDFATTEELKVVTGLDVFIEPSD